MAAAKKTLYEILGVPRDANALDIRLAHERCVAEMRRRPAPDPNAEALVQQAFEILSSEKRRAAYDAQLLTASEKLAAEQQGGAPDLEIGEEEAPKRKLPVVPIAIGAVVVVVALFFALRSPEAPRAPEPAPVAEAPKAAAPPPPKLRTGPEILGSAATSAGRLMAYSMSGAASPIGMAIAIEAGTMVTTCHAIPAGGKLVVSVGKEQYPADLTITDEALDLCRLSLPGFTTPPPGISAEAPKAGDRIFTLGQGAKGELTVNEGTVKAVRKAREADVLEVSTPITPQGSGGGVFDAYGKLVGIATAPHDHGAGLHIAIPATAITEMRSRTR